MKPIKLISALLLASLLAAACCACAEKEQVSDAPTATAEAPSSAAAATTAPTTADAKSTAPSEAASKPKDEPGEEPEADCAAFTGLLEESGYEGELGCSQLIVVKSSDSSATVSCFDKTGGSWQEVEGLKKTDGFVGSMGVSPDAAEYVEYTPEGLFPLGTAFGIYENPGTAMEYFDVTEDSYWVDDPESEFYNQHVEGTDEADWLSAEHLIDSSVSYRYAVFIAYNTDPIIPGKGSAFFLHVGYEPTAGCVAIPEEKMVAVLKWLDPEADPKILIF